MYKIGDFSQLGQVSTRMLRHYDKLDLLKPGQVDKWTGYRYYTLDQLPRLNRIVMLRELGFSLEEIGTMLDDELSLGTMQSLFSQRKREIEKQLREEAERLKRVSLRLRQIEIEGAPFPYDVSVKRLPGEMVVGMHQIVPHVDQMPDYRGKAIGAVFEWVKTHDISFINEVVHYFNREYNDENIIMLYGVSLPLEQKLNDQLFASLPEHLMVKEIKPFETAASIVHHGSIYEIPLITSSLYQWIGLNGYASAGSSREIHHFGLEAVVFNEGRQDDIVYEIVLPVEKF